MNSSLLFLGTGTSSGIPVVGCSCGVCGSNFLKNRRLRTSLLVRNQGRNIIIDTSYDFRQQALAHNINSLDAIFLTHGHADHLFGLDETRVFYFYNKKRIPIYGNEQTLEVVRNIFSYAFNPLQKGGGIPEIDLITMDEPVTVAGVTFEAVPVWHGKLPVLGYRFHNVAYITDASHIEPEAMEKLRGLDILILNALRHRPHSTHFNLEQALAVIDDLKPKQAYLTHICHELDHEVTEKELPSNVQLAYDGLSIPYNF